MIETLMTSTAPAPAVELKPYVPPDYTPRTPSGRPTNIRLPSKAVTARFGISRRTLDRWLRDSVLNFPRPLVINHRLYFALGEIEAWETACAKRHALARATEAA